jgi:uncharacterized protein YjbI with pentapeptide repeats
VRWPKPPYNRAMNRKAAQKHAPQPAQSSGRTASAAAAAEEPTSDGMEHEKLAAEIAKLKEEITKLRSENSLWGALTRNAWPLVSGVLTITVSFVALTVSYRSQAFNADEERRKTFFSALQMATDNKAGQDARIAGIWTLSDYWHDPQYSGTVANALAAVLATDPDDNSTIAFSKVKRLRQAAAIVIGNAIDEKTALAEATRLRILLYGDGPKGLLGAVTRYQQNLSTLKGALFAKGEDIQSVEDSLQNTREAIRQNWENLEFAMFAAHDLTGIDLYQARAHGAYFGKAKLVAANLCGADLSGSTIAEADISYADLHLANIDSINGWETANFKGANISDVANAPKGFREKATRDGALELDLAAWQDKVKSLGYQPPPDAIYTNCRK